MELFLTRVTYLGELACMSDKMSELLDRVELRNQKLIMDRKNTRNSNSIPASPEGDDPT
jgi:hypothetical protein